MEGGEGSEGKKKCIDKRLFRIKTTLKSFLKGHQLHFEIQI